MDRRRTAENTDFRPKDDDLPCVLEEEEEDETES